MNKITSQLYKCELIILNNCYLFLSSCHLNANMISRKMLKLHCFKHLTKEDKTLTHFPT